jgi:hypothetical protein
VALAETRQGAERQRAQSAAELRRLSAECERLQAELALAQQALETAGRRGGGGAMDTETESEEEAEEDAASEAADIHGGSGITRRQRAREKAARAIDQRRAELRASKLGASASAAAAAAAAASSSSSSSSSSGGGGRPLGNGGSSASPRSAMAELEERLARTEVALAETKEGAERQRAQSVAEVRQLSAECERQSSLDHPPGSS